MVHISVPKFPIKNAGGPDEMYFEDYAIIRDINVYEDVKIKNRPIGFVWPERNLIVKV